MNQPKSVFDFLRARGEEFFVQVSNELMSNQQFLKAMQAAWKGREAVDSAVAQALSAMNVPSRAEFKRLGARIDTLEQELMETRRGVDVLRAEVKKTANARAAAASPLVASRTAGSRSASKKAGSAKKKRSAAGAGD